MGSVVVDTNGCTYLGCDKCDGEFINAKTFEIHFKAMHEEQSIDTSSSSPDRFIQQPRNGKSVNGIKKVIMEISSEDDEPPKSSKPEGGLLVLKCKKQKINELTTKWPFQCSECVCIFERLAQKNEHMLQRHSIQKT